MIIDKLAYYKTSAGSESLGGYADGNSEYMRFRAAGAHDGHRKFYLNIFGVAQLSGGASPKITINLTSGEDGSTFGQTDYTTGAIDIPDGIKRVPLPEGIDEYSRIEWTVSGAPTGGGTFKAFISAE